MGCKAFLLLISSLIATHATESRLLDSPTEASDTSPFAECNPFNYQAKGITSCEEYFQKFPLNIEACDLNLAWHDICFGAVPEGKGSLREICPDECGSKVLDPELENEDALAVQNFIDFLENYEEDELKDGRRNLGAPTCIEGFQDVTNGNAYWWYCGRHCPGGRYWTDYYCNCACERVYSKIGYSQCFTRSTQYPGDRVDNPLFNNAFIGVMTGSECEARCNSDRDPHGRPCVAFEHSSQNYDASANCALAWACDYTQRWNGGAVYKRN